MSVSHNGLKRPALARTGELDLWEVPPKLPATHYLDNRIYTDERVLALEQTRLFRRTWTFVCHESELPQPGSFLTVDVGGMPIVVVRDLEGVIRAFFNVCAHRGARLVRETAGRLAEGKIQCFYHHWTYSTRGDCLFIPKPEGYRACGLRREDIRLRAVRVETQLGLVFVNVDSGATPLVEFLGPALDHVKAALGTVPLEVFHLHRTELKANWKLFVETNAEGYHELLHNLNRSTGLAQPQYRERKWVIYPRGHATFSQATISYDKLDLGSREQATLPGMDPNGHIVADVFPVVMVNVRATVMRIDTATPLAPGLTLVECRGLGIKGDSPETRETRKRQHNQVWGPFGRNLPEDFWAVETQWANMHCGASRYSIVSREDALRGTDDAPLRGFYSEWRRIVGIASHDVDAEPVDTTGD